MGCCYRPIETNPNEFAADVHVRLNDIHFPYHDDWNDVNETIIGHHNHRHYIQDIRAVGNGNDRTKNRIRSGAHCMRRISLVQVSQHGIVAVTCVRLVSIR